MWKMICASYGVSTCLNNQYNTFSTYYEKRFEKPKSCDTTENLLIDKFRGKAIFSLPHERSKKVPKHFGQLNCFVITGQLSTCSRFVNGISNNITELLLLLNNIGFHHLLDACLK